MVESRYDLIYKNYIKYRSKSALGFCSSRLHAETMAKEFCSRDIPSVAVYSGAQGDYAKDRKTAIQKLKSGEIKVIFSVDMFNEGVDIPAIDMVMFLRPTESPIVFLQQLGRGLRQHKGKKHLNVLDFIGNYKKAANAPFLLSGEPYSREKVIRYNQQDFNFPDGCIVDFDFRLIDLFKEMEKRSISKKDRIQEDFYRVKEFLNGSRPTRVELFTYMNEEIYELCITNSAINPFRRYLTYLHELNELEPEAEKLYNSIGREFLNTIETTNMTKSYKMPLLNAFYNSGDIKMEITEDDVYHSFKDFYNQGINGRDLLQHKGTRDYNSWDKKEYLAKAKEQPVKYLKRSGNGFFVEKEGYVLALNEDLREVTGMEDFKKHMGDIIEYRTVDYYRRRFLKE